MEKAESQTTDPEEEWTISWYGRRTGVNESDTFANEDEAREALANFRIRYPWNTYKLSRVVEVVESTAPYPAPDVTILPNPPSEATK